MPGKPTSYVDPYTSALGKMKAGTPLSGLTPDERQAVQDETAKMAKFKSKQPTNPALQKAVLGNK